MREAWAEAVHVGEGRPTAAIVRDVVAQYRVSAAPAIGRASCSRCLRPIAVDGPHRCPLTDDRLGVGAVGSSVGRVSKFPMEEIVRHADAMVSIVLGHNIPRSLGRMDPDLRRGMAAKLREHARLLQEVAGVLDRMGDDPAPWDPPDDVEAEEPGADERTTGAWRAWSRSGPTHRTARSSAGTTDGRLVCGGHHDRAGHARDVVQGRGRSGSRSQPRHVRAVRAVRATDHPGSAASD
jgi:hypothetical protein